MKTTVIVGKDKEFEEEVRVKEYPSGKRVIESGDAQNIIKGERPAKNVTTMVTASERKKIRKEPNKFALKDNRLVPKGKNK